MTLRELLPDLSEKELEAAIPQFVTNLHRNKGEKFGAFYPITPEVTTEILQLAL